jgi:hypothetical protein
MSNPIKDTPTAKQKLITHKHFLPYHIGRDLKEAGGCLYIIALMAAAIFVLPILMSIFRGG